MKALPFTPLCRHSATQTVCREQQPILRDSHSVLRDAPSAPRLEWQKEGDLISLLRIFCPCGQILEIKFDQ